MARLSKFVSQDILENKKGQTIENIDFNLIRENVKNRTIRDYISLAEDISEDGLEQPLVLNKNDDGTFEIIAGHRRFKAIQHNISTGSKQFENGIPSIVKNLDPLEMNKRRILSNFMHEELSVSDRLNEIQELQDIYKEKKRNGEKMPGRIRKLMANDLGLSAAQIGNYQQIIKHAIPEVRAKLEGDKITIKEAVALASLEDEDQLKFIEDGEDISLETIREYKNRLKDDEEEENENVPPSGTNKTIEETLLNYLPTMDWIIVKLIQNGKGSDYEQTINELAAYIDIFRIELEAKSKRKKVK